MISVNIFTPKLWHNLLNCIFFPKVYRSISDPDPELRRPAFFLTFLDPDVTDTKKGFRTDYR
jgi:hypothetical protein